jgi:hypothetical protein
MNPAFMAAFSSFGQVDESLLSDLSFEFSNFSGHGGWIDYDSWIEWKVLYFWPFLRLLDSGYQFKPGQ